MIYQSAIVAILAHVAMASGGFGGTQEGGQGQATRSDAHVGDQMSAFAVDAAAGQAAAGATPANSVPEMIPVSQLFFTHGDTNELDAQYRDGRYPKFKEHRGHHKTKTYEDGTMKQRTRLYEEIELRPTVYDTAMALLFGARPVKNTKPKGSDHHMHGILMRLMKEHKNDNFTTVTCEQLSAALAETQAEIKRREGWDCYPDVVVNSEDRINALSQEAWNSYKLFEDHRNGDTDERLVQGVCNEGDRPVYFSQNNRSLYALKMVQSLFQCEMNVLVNQMDNNRLTKSHIFDVRKFDLNQMGLRFWRRKPKYMVEPRDEAQWKTAMYDEEWVCKHPRQDEIHATFPGVPEKDYLYVGYFQPAEFRRFVIQRLQKEEYLGLNPGFFGQRRRLTERLMRAQRTRGA